MRTERLKEGKKERKGRMGEGEDAWQKENGPHEKTMRMRMLRGGRKKSRRWRGKDT